MATRNIPHLCNLFSNRHRTAARLFKPIGVRCRSSQARIAKVSISNDVDTTRNFKFNPFAPVDESKKAFLEELRPPVKKSFNFAAYVNQSETLQELLKLGVSLYDIENTDNNAAKRILNLDFHKHCVPYIRFLVDSGLKEKNLGRFISEYPGIFSQHIDDLQTRINYLVSKGFSLKMVAKALNRSAKIIKLNTKSLDYKLGQLQIEFKLSGDVLRTMITQNPDIVALPCGQYKLVKFTLLEEFGFTFEEIHNILARQPQVLEILRPVLIERLDFIHNTVGLSHETIVQFPKLITGPTIDIRHRFLYLKKLSRDQFDPCEPLYVPPSALYEDTDEDFCSKYTKTSFDDYKLFLRTCC